MRPLLSRAGRLLAGPLSRLRQTLERLRGQLREAVAEAVGQAVAGVVRAALEAAPGDSPARRPGSYSSSRPASPYRRSWEEPEDPTRAYYPDEYAGEDYGRGGYPEDDAEDGDLYSRPLTQPAAPQPTEPPPDHRPARWLVAVALGS